MGIFPIGYFFIHHFYPVKLYFYFTGAMFNMGFLDGFKKRFDSYLPVYYIPFNEYIEAI
jgi:hypothetical protein